MQWPSARDFSLQVFTTGAMLLALLLEGYARKCGFLLTSDSLQYLSAAKSFGATGVFLSPDGSRYAYWPPLFPMLINLFDDPLQGVWMLHTGCKLAIGVLVYKISCYYLRDFATRATFIFAVLLGLHLLLISVFVWSELVFATLALALFLVSTCPTGRWRTSLLFVLGFLLCLQRNAGVFWIVGLCVASLVKEGVSIKSLRFNALFFLVATSGFWVWNGYNTWMISADFAFYQQTFLRALSGNAQIAGTSLAAAFVPATSHAFWGVLFALLFTLACVGVWRFRTHALAQPICLALVYCLGFIAMGPLDGYEADRYFFIIPWLLYLPVLRLVEVARTRFSVSTALVVVFLLVGSAYPISRTLRNAHRWHERSCEQPQAPQSQ
jgi:hypothetical protein